MIHKFLLRSALLVLIIPFIHACIPGNYLIHEADLHDIDTRLERMEKCQGDQLDKIDRLMKAYDVQNQLIQENIEQSTRKNEFLDDFMEKSRPGVFLAHQSAVLSGFETISTDKLLVGEIEKVRLTPPGHVFHARIDTGATTSSLDARDIETFERDGNAWVRFKVAEHEKDSPHELERPIERYVRVLQSSNDETDRRPVVRLQFELGRIALIEEFTLVDRKHLDYQVLIGRNILKDLIVVDVAQKFLVPLHQREKNRD